MLFLTLYSKLCSLTRYLKPPRLLLFWYGSHCIFSLAPPASLHLQRYFILISNYLIVHLRGYINKDDDFGSIFKKNSTNEFPISILDNFSYRKFKNMKLFTLFAVNCETIQTSHNCLTLTLVHTHRLIFYIMAVGFVNIDISSSPLLKCFL